MRIPDKDDYIDIHTHGAAAVPGIFSIETLMAHEKRIREDIPGIGYTFGIHPWHLDETNRNEQISGVLSAAAYPLVIAIGEAGFDRLKGPTAVLQREVFEEQVHIAEQNRKPMVIHCVRAWDELLQAHRKLKPEMPWMIHGFRGKADLALQLISKGMYLSFWFDFVMRPEAVSLLREVPVNRIFLETDGAEIDIRDIYNKVSVDLGLTINKLKSQIHSNFCDFFKA